MKKWSAPAAFTLVALLTLCAPRPRASPPQGAPSAPASPELPRQGALEVEIDATQGPGQLGVRLSLRDLPVGERLYFKRQAPETEIGIADLSVSTADGRPLPVESAKDRFFVGGLPEGAATVDLEVRYTAKPGGLGRHGHQGWVGEDWASFDGRVVLAPTGAQDLASLRVRYQVPEGWAVVSPFRQEGEGYRVDDFGAANWEALSTACTVLGRFEVAEPVFGQTPVQIATYGGWEDDSRAALVAGARSMAEFFHDALGFDPGRRFIIAFTPSGPEGKPVFGGAWSTGACYERPRGGVRNWELLGHRFAHPLNKDLPTGLTIRDPRDHWFVEGWASYIELVATERTGLDEKGRGWNRLYGKYLDAISAHPDHRAALAREPLADGELKEFQHYTQGPLVAKLLDQTLRQRSGKDLEGFMKDLFARYGGFRAPVPLREELEAYAGVPLDDFFALYVDGVAPIGPVGEEWLDRADPEGMGPVVGSVGDLPLTEGYVHYLLREGGFDDLGQLQEWLVAVAERERALRERGVALWPERLRDRTSPVGPAARLEMDRALLAYPLALGPAPRSKGCGSAASERPELRLDLSTEGGRLLSELQQAEARYHASRSQLVRSIQLKWGTHDTRAGDAFPHGLAVRASDPFFVLVGWNDAISRATLEVTQGDKVLAAKEIRVEPGWRTSWTTLRGKDLGDARGLLTLKVRAGLPGTGGPVLAERSLWRR